MDDSSCRKPRYPTTPGHGHHEVVNVAVIEDVIVRGRGDISRRSWSCSWQSRSAPMAMVDPAPVACSFRGPRVRRWSKLAEDRRAVQCRGAAARRAVIGRALEPTTTAAALCRCRHRRRGPRAAESEVADDRAVGDGQRGGVTNPKEALVPTAMPPPKASPPSMPFPARTAPGELPARTHRSLSPSRLPSRSGRRPRRRPAGYRPGWGSCRRRRRWRSCRSALVSVSVRSHADPYASRRRCRRRRHSRRARPSSCRPCAVLPTIWLSVTMSVAEKFRSHRRPPSPCARKLWSSGLTRSRRGPRCPSALQPEIVSCSRGVEDRPAEGFAGESVGAADASCCRSACSR